MRSKSYMRRLLPFCGVALAVLSQCKLNQQKDLRNRNSGAAEPSPSSIGGSSARLTLARIDAGQKTAQIHQVDMGQTIQKDAIVKEITLTPGCTQTLQSSTKLQAAVADTKIKKISIRGFANGDSGAASEGRYNISFNTFQTQSASWDWTFTADGGSSSAKVKQPGSLDEMVFQVDGKDDKAYIWQTDLIKMPDPILFNDSSDIKVSWKTRNLGDISYIRFFLRGKTKSTYCVFTASDNSGKIASSALKNIDGNAIQISTELESHSYYAAQGFLVSSHDWKQGMLVRQ